MTSAKTQTRVSQVTLMLDMNPSRSERQLDYLPQLTGYNRLQFSPGINGTKDVKCRPAERRGLFFYECLRVGCCQPQRLVSLELGQRGVHEFMYEYSFPLDSINFFQSSVFWRWVSVPLVLTSTSPVFSLGMDLLWDVLALPF